MLRKNEIYVASSWRNEARYREVLNALRLEGYSVYDFKNPKSAFGWADCGLTTPIGPIEYLKKLNHPKAVKGFQNDKDALDNCKVLILVLPCGLSAHLELGYAAGAGKKTIILLDGPIENPELMYKLADHIVDSVGGVLNILEKVDEHDHYV